MLSLLAASSLLAGYVAPLSAPGVSLRASPVTMGGEKKVWAFNNFEDTSAVFEVREVDAGVPPVQLLSKLEELKVSTAISEAGLLTFAEENGVFSKLEELGAFSTAEKLLPLVEKYKLLSFVENCLNVPNGYLFTGALTLLTFAPNLLMLQGFAIVPFVQLPTDALGWGLELVVDTATFAAGAVLFAIAFAVGKLQEA